MSLLVRALLVWLLALAIPVQGAVAAGMRCCGPDHHQGQPASADASHAHDHHGMAADHDHGIASDADPHAATPKAGKCSACSSCGTATGLPPRPVALETVPFDDVLVAFVGTPALEFITSGVERPPRPFLA